MRTKAYSAAASLFAALALSGCAIGPQETWTNLGPGAIVTATGRIACYNDANIIDGKRQPGILCATPSSGFLSDGEPSVMAQMGYGRPFKIPFSETLKGVKLPFGDKSGLLQCEPLKADASKSVPESFCKVTANGQPLVSAKVVFQGINDAFKP